MEIKNWSYEEFPAYEENVPGAVRLKTTGEEIGVYYRPNVVYANPGGFELHLQLLVPFTRNEPERLWPALAFVQGSAWMKQDIYKSCAMLGNLARRGYTVAIVEYRHSGIAPFPAQVEDALQAIRFLRAHAAAYSINPEQIFISGCSSGGQVAMFCGLNQQEPEVRVCGILNYYGAVNLLMDDGFPSTPNHHQPDSPEGMLMGGRDLRREPELRKAATVECHITPETALPPVLIFHGTKDRTVSARQSVSLYRKLISCNKEAYLYLLEGADHGGAEFWTDEACQVADRFMRGCLNQPGAHSPGNE